MDLSLIALSVNIRLDVLPHTHRVRPIEQVVPESTGPVIIVILRSDRPVATVDGGGAARPFTPAVVDFSFVAMPLPNGFEPPNSGLGCCNR